MFWLMKKYRDKSILIQQYKQKETAERDAKEKGKEYFVVAV